MKLGLVFSALLLASCAAATPPPKPPPPHATADDCNKVLDNLIAISVRTNFGSNLDPLQQAVATAVVDSYYRENGVTERFFASCVATANTDQTKCMAEAPNLEAVRVCAKKYETKQGNSQ